MNEMSFNQEEYDFSENNNRTVIAVIVAVVCFVVLSLGYTAFRNSNTQSEDDYQDIKQTYVSNDSPKTSQEYVTDDAPITDKQENTAVVTSDEDLQEETEQKTTGPSYSEENASNDRGLYAFTSERLLTYDDIKGLTKRDLSIMRNEIFARHGYIFKSESLRNYFEAQPWYEGLYHDVSSMLSEIELKNVEFIKKEEYGIH